MDKQDTEVAEIQTAWLADNRAKRRWIIVEEADGYSVHEHSWDGVAPPVTYPSPRLAVARLMQLLRIGPVAPQMHPERACIGSVALEP